MSSATTNEQVIKRLIPRPQNKVLGKHSMSTYSHKDIQEGPRQEKCATVRVWAEPRGYFDIPDIFRFEPQTLELAAFPSPGQDLRLV